MYLFLLPSKQISMKRLSTTRSLLSGNLVYKLKKSKLKTQVASLRLLSSLIASVTMLFCTTQNLLSPVENVYLWLFVSIYLKKKTKVDAIVLTRSFIED